MTFDKEFKTAIQNLPVTEKDKLILRLLKKDLNLANRLYFELVDTQTVEDKRFKMQETVSSDVKRMTQKYYSPEYLLHDMRYLSGEITEHLKITKDKFGEITLNLQMLIEVLEQNNSRIINEKLAKTYKLIIYILARTYKIMMLINALHEDYRLEFREDLERLGLLIGQNPMLMKYAIHNGLDVNWLVNNEIPENINAIHRELKSNGFLK